MIIKFKIFENKNRKFQIGDWITSKLDSDHIPFIIIKWDSNLKEYLVENSLDSNNILWIKSKYYRLSTPEEIENIKIKKYINKFNL